MSSAEYPLSDEALIGYMSDDSPLCGEDLHHHFDLLKHQDWIDVGEEGGRLIGLIFFEFGASEIEVDSPIDAVAKAIAAAGSDAALRAVAAAIGVDAGVLREVTERWAFPWANQNGEMPPPIGLEAFGSALAEMAARLAAE